MMEALGTNLTSVIFSIAPALSLLTASAVSLIVRVFSKRRDFIVEVILCLAGLAMAVVLAWRLWPAAQTIGGLTLTTDRLAMVGIVVTGVMVAFTALASPSYLLSRGERRPGYFILLIMSALGMMLLVMASDLITMLLSIETMAISLYALAGFMRDRPQSVEGAIKYFVMGAFATAFFCLGIAFIFGSLGSTDLGVIATRSSYVAEGASRSVFLFGLAMIVVGFAFKMAVVPFHAWAPDTFDGAPTPVSMLLATAAKAAAMLAFLRIALAIAGPGSVMWQHLVWALAAVTIIWGNLAALKQDNIKRMLAYSSIAHVGYMLLAFPLLSSSPIVMARALLLYIVAYCLSTAGAFVTVSMIGLAPGEPVDIRHLSGLSGKKPVLSAVMTLFMLSLAGFPPTLGFFGKYYLFSAAIGSGEVILVLIAVLGTAVSICYYLRPVVAIYFRAGRERDMEPTAEMNQGYYSAMIALVVIAALAVIIFGLFPQNLVALIQASTG